MFKSSKQHNDPVDTRRLFIVLWHGNIYGNNPTLRSDRVPHAGNSRSEVYKLKLFGLLPFTEL